MSIFYPSYYPQVPQRHAGALRRAVFLDVEPAVYTLNGGTVNLTRGYSIPVQGAAYVVAGQDVVIETGVLYLDVVGATYNINGANVKIDRSLKVTGAPYVISGSLIELEQIGVGGAHYLNVDGAVYNIVGGNINLELRQDIDVVGAQYVITGGNIIIARNYVLRVDPAHYVIDASYIDLVRTIADPPTDGFVTVEVKAVNSVTVELS